MSDENASRRPATPLFEEEKPIVLSPEDEERKRAIYERMNPRRRKFVDKIGYDLWNPFQEPKEPLDLRKDRGGRTLRDLLRDFNRAVGDESKSSDWKKGAMECAMGIIKKDEKYQGVFDFCLWYQSVLEREGHSDES